MVLISAPPQISPQAESDADALWRAMAVCQSPERFAAAIKAARALSELHEKAAMTYLAISGLKPGESDNREAANHDEQLPGQSTAHSFP